MSVMDLKYKPQLGSQLTTTLLRVLAMGTVEDAGAVRDTLVGPLYKLNSVYYPHSA
jgi:hypothetical protein